MSTSDKNKNQQVNLFSLKGLWIRLIDELKSQSFISWSGLSFRSKNRSFFEKSM